MQYCSRARAVVAREMEYSWRNARSRRTPLPPTLWMEPHCSCAPALGSSKGLLAWRNAHLRALLRHVDRVPSDVPRQRQARRPPAQLADWRLGVGDAEPHPKVLANDAADRPGGGVRDAVAARRRRGAVWCGRSQAGQQHTEGGDSRHDGCAALCCEV